MTISNFRRQYYQSFGMSQGIPVPVPVSVSVPVSVPVSTPLETETNRGEGKDENSPEFSSGMSLKEVRFPSQSCEPSSGLDGITTHDNNHNTDTNVETIEEGARALERANAHEKRGCSNSASLGLLLEQVLFFLTGLGSSIGYIATLSSLVYFKVLFGANSFVYLNCAVFLPLLPISLAQAVWDSRFDLLYQSRVTFLVRGVLGYAFVMSGTMGMVAFAHRSNNNSSSSSNDDNDNDNSSTHAAEGLEWVIFFSLLQGIGGAVLFGLLNQLASFVGSLHQNQNTGSTINININATTDDQPSDENDALPKKFKAAVSAGVQASALVVLVASITSGFDTMNGTCFANFLVRILQVEVLCLLAFLWLIMARSRIQASMMRRDTSMMELSRFSSDLEDFHQLLSSSSLPSPVPQETSGDYNNIDDINIDINVDIDIDVHDRMRLPLLRHPSSSDGSSGNTNSEQTMLTLRELLYCSRMLCLGMALTLVPSFLVGSWFTRVQTSWMELAQILFYVRIGSDLAGRFATILVPPCSIRCAVWIAGLRCIAVVVFFANASSSIPLHSQGRDTLSIGLVGLIAFCSGYLVTSFYQLAPQQLPGTTQARAANVAKQSTLLTVAFSLSAIGGLVTSFVFVAIGV
jgi:hypothetical protein